MMVTVYPSAVQGSVQAPASKSVMQRACAAALVRKGTSIIHNPGTSNDDNAAIGIIEQLGATLTHGDPLTIQSNGIRPAGPALHCGESGLSARLFTSLAAVSDLPLTIEGEGSLLKRPFGFFDAVLPQLGVRCSSREGKLPLQIRGPLRPESINIDGSLSSQYLTGLLFAYAAAGATGVTITVEGLRSKPYIDLTLDVLRAFRLPVPQNHNYERFFYGQASTDRSEAPVQFTVEGDWSGAAFLLVAGAIAGGVEVRGLNAFSTQADKAVLQALMQTGAPLSIEEHRVEIRQGRLRAFHFDAVECPDLFPPLVALAAFCEGTSVIEGVHRLTHKESNRALTLQAEFGKMGVEVRLQDDLILIEGVASVAGTTVSSHEDHRIAMACAVAALRGGSGIRIDGAGAVSKSYPLFWEHLQAIGAGIVYSH